MKRIRITDARRICEAADARQVIVLAFDESGRFAGASYGETSRECGTVGKLLDAIADGLQAGRLPNPRGA